MIMSELHYIYNYRRLSYYPRLAYRLRLAAVSFATRISYSLSNFLRVYN